MRPQSVSLSAADAGDRLRLRRGRTTASRTAGHPPAWSCASEDFFPTLKEFFSELADSHWPTVLLSAGLLALILVLRRFVPRVPGTLVAVVLAGVLSELFDFEEHGIAVVGASRPASRT